MDEHELEEQAKFDRTEQARKSLERERDNLRAQIMYMCSEIATALRLPLQTPAGTVQSVRDLALVAGIRNRGIEDDLSEHAKLIREQQRSGTGEITAVMVSPIPCIPKGDICPVCGAQRPTEVPPGPPPIPRQFYCVAHQHLRPRKDFG